MHKLILLACLLQTAFAAPQFVTFKDGKVGVNFGGFHADAGLGGLLTGDAAHGGLSASAGTPWGPQAAAGLGGSLDGRATGVAYAGAAANPTVGASAVLAGNAGENGFAGSEAHAGGKVTSKTITSTHHRSSFPVDSVTSGPAVMAAPPSTDAIQRIKPPKKYSLIKHNAVATHASADTYTSSNNNHANNFNAEFGAVHSKHLLKPLHRSPLEGPPPPPTETNVHVDSGLIGGILNIPIGILRSLQDSIGGLEVDKSVSLTKG